MNLGFGRASSPVYSVSPNRFSSKIRYGGSDGSENAFVLNSTTDMWGSGSQIYGDYSLSSDGFDNFGAIWANLISGEGGGGGSSFNGGGGGGVNSIEYGRNNSGGGDNSIAPASFGGGSGSGGSFYADSTWNRRILKFQDCLIMVTFFSRLFLKTWIHMFFFFAFRLL